jgi:hypothetical protein
MPGAPVTPIPPEGPVAPVPPLDVPVPLIPCVPCGPVAPRRLFLILSFCTTIHDCITTIATVAANINAKNNKKTHCAIMHKWLAMS